MTDTKHLVDGKFGICDLVDLVELRRIFERFTQATGFTIGFLDHPGLNILIDSGWRDICTKFHRCSPISAANCMRSNRHLLDNLTEPDRLVVEKCENGLVDCAFPIMVKGKHIASLATGQLLLEPPDHAWFRTQARVFGLDEEAYLKALDEVPVVPEEKLRKITRFLGELARVLSELGYAKLLIKEDAQKLENEIADRKKAEEALRQSEDHYRSLFNLGSDAILVIDVETLTILDTNVAAESMYGYARSEILGMRAVDLWVAPETIIAEIQNGEGIVHSSRSRHRRKNGMIFYVDIAARFFLSDGRKKVLASMRDVSEHVRVEEERRRLEEQLQQSQKLESVGRLAGGVAHDFNNMLGVILGYAEMALEHAPPSHLLRADLNEIRSAATRSSDLTRQLLTFARKQTILPKVLNLNETVVGTLGLMKRLIGENIHLEWRPSDTLWPIIIDPSQIDQILTNLCANARDAICDVGTINIETENCTINEEFCQNHPGAMVGEFVQLSVSDNGCGMDKDVLAHVFEPFYTTKGVGKGLGLGLATVYGIINQNNGFVSVSSRPGRGTVFRLYFPRHRGEVVQSKEATTAPPVPPGKETILLVEDEASLLAMTSKALERQGYTVLSASCPAVAIRLAQEHGGKIDLLMTDVIMPEMNGLELAKNILPLFPKLKRLFMSGYTADVIANHGVLDEGVNFIQKPFSMHDLAIKVREVLAQDKVGSEGGLGLTGIAAGDSTKTES